MATANDTTTTPDAHSQTAAGMLPEWEALRRLAAQAGGAQADAVLPRLFDLADRIAEAPAPTAADVLAKLQVAVFAARVEHGVAPVGRLPWHWDVVASALADLEALS